LQTEDKSQGEYRLHAEKWVLRLLQFIQMQIKTQCSLSKPTKQ